MKRLIDIVDSKSREEFGEYYVVSKNRIDNLVDCYEGGVIRIKELTAIVVAQQEEIKRLSDVLMREEV